MSAIANQIVIEPTDLDSENEYLDVEYLKEEWITPDGYDGEHQSNSDEEISMKNNSGNDDIIYTFCQHIDLHILQNMLMQVINYFINCFHVNFAKSTFLQMKLTIWPRKRNINNIIH